jgi:hypothetical protein
LRHERSPGHDQGHQGRPIQDSLSAVFGNRKQDENEPVKPGTTVLAVVLLVTAILGICIYAFLTGKLG